MIKPNYNSTIETPSQCKFNLAMSVIYFIHSYDVYYTLLGDNFRLLEVSQKFHCCTSYVAAIMAMLISEAGIQTRF